MDWIVVMVWNMLACIVSSPIYLAALLITRNRAKYRSVFIVLVALSPLYIAAIVSGVWLAMQFD